MMKKLRVILWKPSGYGPSGHVTRFWRGFMPNASLLHMASMTPSNIDGVDIEVRMVDEYVETDLRSLELLRKPDRDDNLVALVGVQSHQFPHAADLAAYAVQHGSLAVIGGPHPITCDTSMHYAQNGRLSFALSEAETIWSSILTDAARGGLKQCYGTESRWTAKLPPLDLMPPSRKDLQRHIVPMVGYYAERGCAMDCSFCAIPEMAGKRERSQPLENVLTNIRTIRQSGVKRLMFTADNFNQWSLAKQVMRAMVEDGLRIPFFCQCTTVLWKDEEFWDIASRAGCRQIFFGVESTSREVLRAEHKHQNDPRNYRRLVELGIKYHIEVGFSNMIGFPSQTRGDVLEQLAVINELGPYYTYWYIMTPMPGTRDYADYRHRFPLDPDLSRYDATQSVFAHPNFAPGELEELLYHCYSTSYRLGNALKRAASYRPRSLPASVWGQIKNSLFIWLCAHKHRHPMQGGLLPLKADHEDDYRPYREMTFGFRGHYPLPDNRPLSSADREMNRLINPATLAEISKR